MTCVMFERLIQLDSFRETLGVKVVKALKRKDDAISHAAVDTLCALMQVSGHTIIFLLLIWPSLHNDSQCTTTLI